MKKIIAINSPIFEDKDVKNNEDYLPPLGIGIVVSSLDEYDIEFVDSIADNLSLQEVLSKINAIKPDFILINIFTTNFLLIKKIVENILINTHWIIGGLSTKSLYSEIFKWETHNLIDVIYGDGELIVNDIINSSLQEQPIQKDNSKRYFIVNKTSKYYVKDISEEKLNREIFKNEPQINIHNELEISIYTSRGCPYNCAYCVAASSRNRDLGVVRRKNSNKIIAELDEIKTIYPKVTAIRVLDDLFLSNKQSFNEATLIFNRFRFNWRAMCHIKSINSIEDKVLENIKDSGCRELFVGIESGSPQILKRIHKTDNIDTILKSVERVLKIGISVKGYFICGFPNETVDDLRKTYELATKLTDFSKKHKGKFRNSTFQFRPYYGTELYDEIVEVSNISKDSILYKVKISDSINKNVRDKSFNFDSGNYSLISDEELNNYIKK
ncbi:B12-binding domain-containing radical SAM protein [Lutibacter sp.]